MSEKLRVQIRLYLNVFLLSLITTNVFANQDAITSCPSVKQLYAQSENVTYIRFYGINNVNESFKANSRNLAHSGYLFLHYTPKAINVELSRYDEVTGVLSCVYDIDVYDAATNLYYNTKQNTLQKLNI